MTDHCLTTKFFAFDKQPPTRWPKTIVRARVRATTLTKLTSIRRHDNASRSMGMSHDRDLASSSLLDHRGKFVFREVRIFGTILGASSS